MILPTTTTVPHAGSAAGVETFQRWSCLNLDTFVAAVGTLRGSAVDHTVSAKVFSLSVLSVACHRVADRSCIPLQERDGRETSALT